MGMIRRALIGLLLLAPLAWADEYSATGLTAGSTYRGCGAWENEATPPLTATVVCSGEWATTAAGDTTPDAFAFTDLTGQPLGSTISSNIVTITGLTAPAVVTISGDPSCQFSVNGAAATAVESSITNGQTLQLFVDTEGLYLDQFSCASVAGGVSDTWYVTTRVETYSNVTPNVLDNTRTNATPNTQPTHRH